MNLEEYLSNEPSTKLDIFLDSLSATNRTPEYYVNWEKVDKETKKFELELNTLNYLIGKDNIVEEAKQLFSSQPNLLKAVPSLIAARDKELDVLIMDENDNMNFLNLDFKNIDITRLETYIEFIENTGLLDFFQNHARQNLVDYVYGVETGLDSNGRKNRSGTIMEDILERKVTDTCERLGYEHKAQATSKWIEENWGVIVPVDKSKRRFDEAIFDEKHCKVYVLETNYYGGGGSKLKSVSGEFKTLNNLIDSAEDNVQFVWVTDGQGWKTAKIPLSEAFEDIPYVFNLKMLSVEFLEQLIK